MAQEDPPPRVPTRLPVGPVVPLGKLGSGSAGQVFELELGGQRYALKVASAAYREVLAAEAERMALSASRFIPRLHDVGELSQAQAESLGLPAHSPYLLRAYVPGRSLSELPNDADRRGAALALLRDVGNALADLHRVGVAHGDVKPDNVLACQDNTGNWRCTLIDLGLADAIDAAVPRGATPRYLPPELTQGSNGPSDGRTRDLWALGLTLLELLVPAARADASPETHVAALPAAFRHVARALLQHNPNARPGAQWVAKRATGPEGFDPRRSRERVEQSYVAFRKRELQRIARGYSFQLDVQGAPLRWLTDRCELLGRIARMRGIRGVQSVQRLGTLGRDEQRRWLLGLIGPATIDFGALPAEDDARLSERLLQAAEKLPPDAFTYWSLFADERPREAAAVSDEDPADLALLLGAEAPTEAVLARAEAAVFERRASVSFALWLARALKRRQAGPRALAVLDNVDDERAELERAHIALRLGDLEDARARLDGLCRAGHLPDLQSDARALLSRIHILRGDPTAAEAVLAGAEPRFRCLEARANLELTRGHLTRAQTAIDSAASWAHDAEERARVEALYANWAQQSGDPRSALSRFRKAAEYAARAGALLEEATYLIGVASTATPLGELSTAISAADRSMLLFEHLGQAGSAARAALSKAAALIAMGANAEAEAAAQLSLSSSKQAGDRRCQAYAHLALSDVLERSEAREHVQRASALLTDERSDDRLHLAARQLRLGVLDATHAFDRLAQGEASTEAKIEWWGARAQACLNGEEQSHAEPILTALSALLHTDAALAARGEAFAHAAELAARVGDGERTRRFAAAAGAALRALGQGVSADRRGGLLQLPWARSVTPLDATTVAPEQLADIETLIHSLSERHNLRALLDRVLDALIRWTSVERGLLLLTAPGGSLKPRAARNLARKDLTGDQLQLSMSLAERALSTRDCVVAVDASGELQSIHASAHALKLRSVLAVPLIARGEVLGVAYLDDRVRAGAFGKRELGWVRLVSTLAAVAVADARDQLLLRRAARKACRAEARVTHLLAKREAALVLANEALARTRGRQTRFDYDAIVGESAPIRELLHLVDRVIPSDIPVLVLGPSGSGKELIARAIHNNGPRREGPFVSENCSAIPETLLESTLFGHVKGAFTGAARHHAGLFEIAHGGTLFLDEIADMSLGMQAKLLRCLENGEIRRVGSEKTTKVDVRVIGATHKPLDQLVQTKKFREDLYYRLNVMTLAVPPLAQRRADIPLLVQHFLNKYARDRRVTLARGVMEELAALPWPGNVRQLENEIRRALVLADDEIRHEHLSAAFTSDGDGSEAAALNLRARLDALEAQLVQRALAQTLGNQTKAAQLLGVSRFGLQKMIRRLGIDVPALTRDDD